jgi:phosphonatase-like hydrolase
MSLAGLDFSLSARRAPASIQRFPEADLPARPTQVAHATTRIELIALDVVGTLVRDDGHVSAAFAATLAAHGIRFDDAWLDAVRGMSKREALAKLIARASGTVAPAPAVDRIHGEFRERLGRAYRERPPCLRPGAAELLDWIAETGRRAAVTTGLERDLAGSLLIAAAAGALTEHLVCGEDVAQGRPAPYMLFRAMEITGTSAVHNVLAVGDTTADLCAGWNAGVRLNVGVVGGAHARPQLERAPHTHIVASLAAIPALVDAAEHTPA